MKGQDNNMKYFRQFGIILIFTFVAEVLGHLIPLPIPSSIYGLVLMLLALCFKVVKLPQVKEASVFLLEIMPLMFIPVAAGLVVVFPTLRSILIPVLIITVISTIAVMVVSGRVTQFIIRREIHDIKNTEYQCTEVEAEFERDID